VLYDLKLDAGELPNLNSVAGKEQLFCYLFQFIV